MKVTIDRTLRRKRRVSSHIHGTAKRPRIAVYRTNHYIYAQAIDDEGRKTIATYSSLLMKKDAKAEGKMNKSDQAKQVGLKLAELLKEKKVKEAVFDRSRYAYNGRVKVLAEGLREGSIKV